MLSRDNSPWILDLGLAISIRRLTSWFTSGRRTSAQTYFGTRNTLKWCRTKIARLTLFEKK